MLTNKADNIDNKIGYPDFLYNDTFLNDMYEEVSHRVSSYSHFIETY